MNNTPPTLDQNATESAANNDTAITAKTLRIERVTSLSSSLAEFGSHCPNCGSKILVYARGNTCIVGSGRHNITEQRWTTEKAADEIHYHMM
jgi:DNA-directed RNA polymerase subunit RPC12/RpoP